MYAIVPASQQKANIKGLARSLSCNIGYRTTSAISASKLIDKPPQGRHKPDRKPVRNPGRKPIVGAPVGRTMLRLAVPSITMSGMFSLLFVIEAAFVARAGTLALAAVAVVFPMVMLAAMWSGGAFGGAIAGATARANGADENEKLESIVTAAFLVALIGGSVMFVVYQLVAPRVIAFSSSNAEVAHAAEVYARTVFPGLVLFWFLNCISSILRGAGDIVRPAICWAIQVVSFAALSLLLVLPNVDNVHSALHGAAWSMNLSLLAGLLATVFFYFQSGRRAVPGLRTFDAKLTRQIFQQGLIAGSQSLMTILYASLATVLFGRFGTDWLAGYGMAVRLEMVIMPLVFGLGAVLIPMCGAYLGAGRRIDAVKIAWLGVCVNFAVISALGLLLALQPDWWCNAASTVSSLNCRQSLQVLGPTYGVFAAGLTCYVASQAFNTLKYPVVGAFLRLCVVASGFLWVTQDTNPQSVLWLIAAAAIVYGTSVTGLLYRGPWKMK